MIKYNKSNIPVAKMLRKNMTIFEKKLWFQYLKDYPVRFQRQKAIDEFIADFYCAKARLIIELDGVGHEKTVQLVYDAQRTTLLNSLGLQVVRFTNSDIDMRFNTVCKTIDNLVKTILKLKQ